MTRDHSQLNAWAGVHTALLVEGQSRLSTVIGTDSPDWELSLATGLLTLNGCRLQFALLGSVDEDDNTWLWSWADQGLNRQAIPIQRALPLRRFGEESGLWEFTEPSFPMAGIVDLGMTPGATVSIVACPQIMGGAVFSGPYPGGRLYTVVTDPRLTLEPPSAFTAPTFISAALAYGMGGHRDIVMVYAGAHGLGLEESDSSVTLLFDDQTRLEVLFDDHQRIRHMHGIVPPDHGIPPEVRQAGSASPFDTPDRLAAAEGSAR